MATTFVLIHGAWHGAWCWHKVIPLLAASGARVVAPDLPSMGADITPSGVVTLDYWARFVADTIERESEPVVLVGHSRGGIVVSQAAELIPERIRRLVYLSAFLIPAHDTLVDTARTDTESVVLSNMIPAANGLTCTVRASALREAFYGRCTEADFEFARGRVSPEPLKPLVTPLQLTPERFGSVPRTYIETTEDRAVTIGAQRRMQAALPCESVFTLKTDHSAFLSQPEELARILISIWQNQERS